MVQNILTTKQLMMFCDEKHKHTTIKYDYEMDIDG